MIGPGKVIDPKGQSLVASGSAEEAPCRSGLILILKEYARKPPGIRTVLARASRFESRGTIRRVSSVAHGVLLTLQKTPLGLARHLSGLLDSLCVLQKDQAVNTSAYQPLSRMLARMWELFGWINRSEYPVRMKAWPLIM